MVQGGERPKGMMDRQREEIHVEEMAWKGYGPL